MEQSAGEERPHGDSAEDHELVAPLDLAAFRGRVGGGEQGAPTDEQEVPADPQQDERDPEVHHALPRHGDADRTSKHGSPGEEHVGEPVAGDEVAGDEGRREHAKHVPLHDGRGIGQVEPRAAHRQRRGRHDEDHDRVADRRGQQGDPEGRVGADLAHRTLLTGARFLIVGDPQSGVQCGPDDGQCGDHRVGAGVGEPGQ